MGAQTLPHDVCSRRNRETKPTIFKTLTLHTLMYLRLPMEIHILSTVNWISTVNWTLPDKI